MHHPVVMWQFTQIHLPHFASGWSAALWSAVDVSDCTPVQQAAKQERSDLRLPPTWNTLQLVPKAFGLYRFSKGLESPFLRGCMAFVGCWRQGFSVSCHPQVFCMKQKALPNLRTPSPPPPPKRNSGPVTTPTNPDGSWGGRRDGWGGEGKEQRL